MRESGIEGNDQPTQNLSENRQDDEDLQLAMALSEQQLQEDERLRKQEEEELEKIIQLSLLDK